MRDGAEDKLEIREVLAEGAKASHSDLFWSHALLPLAALPVPPPISRDQSWKYYRGNRTTTITGDIYTDGSLRRCWYWPIAARAGWGFVVTHLGALTVAI